MSKKEKPPRGGLRLVHSKRPDPKGSEKVKLPTGKEWREKTSTIEEQRFLKGLAAKLALKRFKEESLASYRPDSTPVDAGVREEEIPKLVLRRSPDDYLEVGLMLEISKVFRHVRGEMRDLYPGKYVVSFKVYPYDPRFQKFSLFGIFDLKEIGKKVLDHFSILEKWFRIR
jgi:hypothetical protein